MISENEVLNIINSPQTNKLYYKIYSPLKHKIKFLCDLKKVPLGSVVLGLTYIKEYSKIKNLDLKKLQDYVLISIIIANKFLGDEFYIDTNFLEACGIQPRNYNTVELDILKTIDYRLYQSDNNLQDTINQMQVKHRISGCLA